MTEWPRTLGASQELRRLVSVLALTLLLLVEASLGSVACTESEQADGSSGSCAASGDAEAASSDDSILRFLRASTRCKPYDLNPSAHFPRTNVQLQKEIQVVNVSDLESGWIQSSFWKENKPVLIRGAAENLFNEVDTAWSIEGILQSQHADQLLPVSYGGRISQSNTRGRMALKEIVERQNMTVSFWNWQFEELSEQAPDVSSRQSLPLKLQKEYFAKMKAENFVRPKGWKKLGGQFNLHLSHRGGALPHSHNPVINVLFQGAKRWILVDPAEVPPTVDKYKFELMDVQPFNSPSTYSAHQWFEDVAGSMPMPFYDFVQEEGEAVFVPTRYTHATVDLCTDTVGTVLGGEFIGGASRQFPGDGQGKGRGVGV
mmetsp:Transcript_21631/g.50542  ORF Transcript_21631/g.50542 Transcript_21631/m.50542 type:complete len:373 (-) Transcript_21631:252-1370(-)